MIESVLRPPQPCGTFCRLYRKHDAGICSTSGKASGNLKSWWKAKGEQGSYMAFSSVNKSILLISAALYPDGRNGSMLQLGARGNLDTHFTKMRQLWQETG
nr:uncharacterized protein LOC129531684 isoform X2 [Gorilla gorilla gorilla]